MIILIIQQNYFSDLYPAKILDFFQQNRSFRVSLEKLILCKKMSVQMYTFLELFKLCPVISDCL